MEAPQIFSVIFHESCGLEVGWWSCQPLSHLQATKRGGSWAHLVVDTSAGQPFENHTKQIILIDSINHYDVICGEVRYDNELSPQKKFDIYSNFLRRKNFLLMHIFNVKWTRNMRATHSYRPHFWWPTVGEPHKTNDFYWFYQPLSLHILA